jgi:hypothetical protein
MSTTPGESTWADAGLIPPEDSELDEPRRIEEPIAAPVELDHEPDAPRPDLRDEATEPDVVEQAIVVPEDEAEEYPEG